MRQIDFDSRYPLHCLKPLFLVASLTLALAPSAFAEEKPAESKKETDKSLAWLADYNQARQTAAKSHKPVWIQFTGPWCPNCHKMDKETFKNTKVIDEISRNYVAAKISCEENTELALSFGFTQLPSTVLISPDGHILARHEGFADADGVHKLSIAAGVVGEDAKPTLEPKTELAAALTAKPAVADLVARPAEEKATIKEREPITVALREEGSKPLIELPNAANPATEPPAPADDARELDPATSEAVKAAQEIVRARESDMPLEPLGRYCPVTLVERAALLQADSTHTAVYAARRYYFADAAARKRFAENPERYVPARGGECLVTLVEEKREVAGSKEFPVVYDHRIFLCSSQDQRDKFLRTPEAFAGEDVRHPGVCSHCKEPINAKSAGDRSRFQLLFGGTRHFFPDKSHMEAFLLSPLKYLR